MVTDRYVLYLPLRLPTLCIVLTHAGRRERSPFEQQTVLGNKKPGPSHFFQRCVLQPQASPPLLPLLALELNLTLPFRYWLGSSSRIWNPIVHRPPLRFCHVHVSDSDFVPTTAHQRLASVTPVAPGVGVQISCLNVEVELPSSLVGYSTRGQHRSIVASGFRDSGERSGKCVVCCGI